MWYSMYIARKLLNPMRQRSILRHGIDIIPTPHWQGCNALNTVDAVVFSNAVELQDHN